MYPVLRTPRGSLMRKCDSDQQALAVGRVYHFYVDETAATNGDGTELSPWNNINNALTEDMWQRCLQSCTKVYVHVHGSINHYIASPAGYYSVYNYNFNLIFLPWNQERVTVNPETNCLYIYEGGEHRQIGVNANNVVFQQFDFIQNVQPVEATKVIMVCFRRSCNLYNCTVTVSAMIDGYAAPFTVVIYAFFRDSECRYNIINSTVNIYASCANTGTRWYLTVHPCTIVSAIDSIFNVEVTGAWQGPSINVLIVIAGGYVSRCTATVELNNCMRPSCYLLTTASTIQTSIIEDSNFSIITSGGRDPWVCGIRGAVQMSSSDLYISTQVQKNSDCIGLWGAGEIINCNITVLSNIDIYSTDGPGADYNDNIVKGIQRSADAYDLMLLVDTCTISALATHSGWPPASNNDNELFELACAIDIQDSELPLFSIIDSDLSPGSCLHESYAWYTQIITQIEYRCGSSSNYPASCLLGA